jgi:PAS domain S-box-containing protein
MAVLPPEWYKVICLREIARMFQEKATIRKRTLLLAIGGVLATVLFAAAVTVWLVVETRKEQRTIARVLQDGSTSVAADVGTLPGELRLQMVFSVLVLVVLVFAAVVLTRVFRAFWVSQESLRQVRTLSWNILASMDHAVVTTNQDGQVTSINPRGYELLGLSSDCVGRPIEDISRDDIPLHSISRRVLGTGSASHDNDFTISQADKTRKLRLDCHLLTDANQHVLGTVLHARDVTDRDLMEERMRRMERFMGLGSLASGLHHEIKNPLSALSLHIQLLEEHFERSVDRQVAENLAVLKTEVTRIGGVLESFRDFASLDRLDRSTADLAQIVERTVRLLRPQADREHIQVTVEVDRGEVPTVWADVARIEQVVLNLVLNAIEAMPDGGRLAIRLSRRPGTVQVEVADTGPGIPQNIQSQVFDLYFTTKSGGSGMGLALCDKIVRQHGGQIDFDTGPDGTVFRLALPLEGSP